MKKKNLIGVAAVLYGCLFLYSGWAKINDMAGFGSALADSPLPAGLLSVLVWGVPINEFLVVVLLIVPRWRGAGLIWGLFLLTCFSIYLLYLTGHPTPSCGCGGWLENLRPGWHLLFNCGFISLGGAASWQTLIKLKTMVHKIFVYTISPEASGNRRSRKPAKE